MLISIAAYLLIGAMVTVKFYNHIVYKSKGAGATYRVKPGLAVLVYIFWPIAIPVILIPLHWPRLRAPDNED